MMRSVVVLVLSLALMSPTAAQPAPSGTDAGAPAEPPAPAPEQPAPPPEQPETPPEATAAVEPPRPEPRADLAVLTPDEREIFSHHRFYNDGQRIGGTVLAVMPGFGLGHVLQGRWLERGWLFTLSQIAGLVILSYGHDRALDECAVGERCTSTGVRFYVAGWVLFAGGWIGGVLDAYITPTRRNNRLLDIRRRAYHSRLIPYVAPARGDGAVAGVSFRF
jgi:hypothetical protein